MDTSLVTPFVRSIQNVFATMLQLPLTARDPVTLRAPVSVDTVSGVVVLSGDIDGTVTLRMPRETAARVVALFCGERVEESSAAFSDALAELVNMVSGGAKAGLPAVRSIRVSCPEVRLGDTGAPALDAVIVPCDTDCGSFSLEVEAHRTAPTERAAA